MKPLKSRLLDSAVEPTALHQPVMEPPASLPPPSVAGITDLSGIPAVSPPARPIRVMICIPSAATWISRTATAVAGMMGFSIQQGLSLGIINLEGSMITKQRMDLVEGARKQESDYMLFVDSDMTMPPDALVRLLAHQKEICGATYNKKVFPYETLGRLCGPMPTEDQVREGGLRRAELLPTGLLLIKMSVFDKIKWPFFYESYMWPGASGVEALQEYIRANYCAIPPEDALEELKNCEKLSAWLNEVHRIENVNNWGLFSEDLNFCRKCVKAGIEIWCDLSLTFECAHIGSNEVVCKPPPKPTVLTPAVM